jgi:radical SAM protein with 4Fe4S-binding SPASM domain
MFVRNLEKASKVIGQDRISALMTTTKKNIHRLPEVVDEYIRLGFRGIFLRDLNPYGFAVDNRTQIGYDIDNLLKHKSVLDHLIALNIEALSLPNITQAFTPRLLTPFGTGLSISNHRLGRDKRAIYDYNGDVYPADEARMLARMGDTKFLMGNVFKDTYREIFYGNTIKDLVRMSCVEIMPQCATCPFQVYCGADPVRNYLDHKDVMGHRPSSEFCRKNMAIFRHLFSLLLQNDDKVMDVFWSWITSRHPITEGSNSHQQG